MESKIYKVKTSSGEILCHKMTIANNIFDRMKGLMFSKELPECDGFLIRPCNSIHTFFMRYPLDIVFLDKNFKVIKVLYNLKPWRMTWVYLKSFQVLEMKAGTLTKNLNQGETLEAVCLS